MQHIALKYFQEVAESGSVSDAAVRLNVSASAVSRQVQKLEETLGAPLFERRPRGMVLSTAGQTLYRHVKRIALETDMAMAEVRALQGPESGHVRLASYEGYALDRLSVEIGRFHGRFPNVSLHAWVGNSVDICAKVLSGDVDIGVTYCFPAPPGLQVQLVQPRPIHALIPKSDPLAQRASVTLADLRERRFALPDGGRTQRQLIETALAVRGISLSGVLASNSMALLNSASRQLGCVMFSTSVSEEGGHALSETHVSVLVEEEVFSGSVMQVVTMAGRSLPQPVQSFLEIAWGIKPAAAVA